MHRTTTLAAAAAIFGLVSSQDTSSIGTTASVGNLDWPNITIQSISFSGNGCPQGAAKLVAGNEAGQSHVSFARVFPAQAKGANPGQWLHFNVDSFNVSIGPGIEASERTKNCQAHLNLLYPQNVVVAATAALTRGYGHLDDGVSASWFSTYFYSQDAGLTTTTQKTIQGGGDWAHSRPFRRLDAVPDVSRVWSPCGANAILNANVRISLTSGLSNATGAISLADSSQRYNVGLRLDWKPCER
jgi:hypothetical protein